MDYWLIDLSTGAGQGCYDSLNGALQAAADEVEASAQESLDALAIVVFKRDGSLEQYAHGKTLVQQAYEHFPLIGCRYSAIE